MLTWNGSVESVSLKRNYLQKRFCNFTLLDEIGIYYTHWYSFKRKIFNLRSMGGQLLGRFSTEGKPNGTPNVISYKN